MYGGTTADAVRALTGALKGNNTMLDNYGMAANDAMIKTKALEMGLYDGTGQMDLASKQAATLALIMEQSAAAQGQAAREAEGASGGMRAFATEIKNLSADIGEILLPILTPLIAKIKDAVRAFGELSPATKKIIVAIAGIAAAIGPLLVVFGPLISVIGTLITGLGAMSVAMTGGATVMAGLSVGFPALGAAITVLTGPIGIVIAAIAALITIGVALYKNWDEIKVFGSRLWSDIRGAWELNMKALADGWNVFTKSISGAWTGMWNNVTALFDAVRSTLTIATATLTAGMLDKWTGFKNGIIEIWRAITGAIKGFINDQLRFVNKLIDALNSIQVDIPEWVPGFGGNSFGINLPHVPALATGTNYVPRDMLAYLHKGEAVVPAEYNQAGPTIGNININITGNNPDEIWSKFERNLHKLGVVF